MVAGATGIVPGSAWDARRGEHGRGLLAVFVCIDDLDAHHAHAVEVGATIVSEPGDHGPDRICIAADCGGQQWIFGTPLS